MSARRWWQLPLPAAVALAVLMPWRAVAEIRRYDSAVRLLARTLNGALRELDEERAAS